MPAALLLFKCSAANRPWRGTRGRAGAQVGESTDAGGSPGSAEPGGGGVRPLAAPVGEGEGELLWHTKLEGLDPTPERANDLG